MLPLAIRHMLATFTASLALLCTSAASGGEEVDRCPQDLPPAEVHVAAEHAFPNIDYSHPSREIQRQLDSAPHTVALGLTQSSTAVSVEVRLRALHFADDETLCARPQVEVTLRHARLEVWVAREVEHDACMARLILQHEMTHVAIERDTLDWAAQQLESQLQAYYQAQVLRGTAAQLRAQLAQDFESRWTPALEALLRSSTPRHAAFDRQDSYGDAEACGGDLQRAARRFQ
jgi:hypothetical protein